MNDDDVLRFERAILGGILIDNGLFCQADGLPPQTFSLSAHSAIWTAMCDLHANVQPIDMLMLAEQLSKAGKLESVKGVEYISSLIDGLPERPSIEVYVKMVRSAAGARHVMHGTAAICELAGKGLDITDLRAHLADLNRLAGQYETNNSSGLFHTYEESVNAPPLKFAINGVLQESAVNMIGGLAGHGKTWILLAMTEALLTGKPLFGYGPFSVPEPAEKVIYLIPESSIGPFWHRLKLFHLEEHVQSERLLYRTMSIADSMMLALDDPRLKQAVAGAHVFLDTAVRFMEGDENDVQRKFAQQLFNLTKAGARSVTGAHHSPKSFTKEEYMTLENVLRGSGEIGAMPATVWGVRQIDEPSNRLYVSNVKARDFQPCEAFILEGRPHIDQRGEFRMVAEPGEAGELSEHGSKGKPGPKLVPDDNERRQRAWELHHVTGHSLDEIAKQMGVSKTTVHRWVKKEGTEQ